MSIKLGKVVFEGFPSDARLRSLGFFDSLADSACSAVLGAVLAIFAVLAGVARVASGASGHRGDSQTGEQYGNEQHRQEMVLAHGSSPEGSRTAPGPSLFGKGPARHAIIGKGVLSSNVFPARETVKKNLSDRLFLPSILLPKVKSVKDYTDRLFSFI